MLQKLLFPFFLIALIASCSETNQTEKKSNVTSTNKYVVDKTRNRQIPIQIYALDEASKLNGELVILNAGYGSSNTEYTYITQELAKKGYYVVAIQHEIQTDELIPSGEDIIELRTPNWTEGIKSIERILAFIQKEVTTVSTEKIHLIGHSNGGDISVLFATQQPKKVRSLITLDHRRMPIPLTNDYKTLSFRADQFEADPGVIPTKSDQKKYDIKIVYFENVDHNYLRDIATQKTKEKVISEILDHLNH